MTRTNYPVPYKDEIKSEHLQTTYIFCSWRVPYKCIMVIFVHFITKLLCQNIVEQQSKKILFRKRQIENFGDIFLYVQHLIFLLIPLLHIHHQNLPASGTWPHPSELYRDLWWSGQLAGFSEQLRSSVLCSVGAGQKRQFLYVEFVLSILALLQLLRKLLYPEWR